MKYKLHAALAFSLVLFVFTTVGIVKAQEVRMLVADSVNTAVEVVPGSEKEAVDIDMLETQLNEQGIVATIEMEHIAKAIDPETGERVCEIPINHELKLLGIVPITLDKTLVVSLDSRNLIDIRQSLVSRFIELFSI